MGVHTHFFRFLRVKGHRSTDIINLSDENAILLSTNSLETIWLGGGIILIKRKKLGDNSLIGGGHTGLLSIGMWYWTHKYGLYCICLSGSLWLIMWFVCGPGWSQPSGVSVSLLLSLPLPCFSSFPFHPSLQSLVYNSPLLLCMTLDRRADDILGDPTLTNLGKTLTFIILQKPTLQKHLPRKMARTTQHHSCRDVERI